MKRILQGSALVIAGAVLFAACGSDDSSSTPEVTSNAETTTAVANSTPPDSSVPNTDGDGPFRAEPAEGDGDGLRIAMIGFQNNPFWDPVVAGAEAAGKTLAAKGAEVDWIVAGAELDMPTIISAIESAVTQGYDAIGVVPLADGACPAIEQAASGGTAIATFIAEGTCSEESGSLFFHGQDGYEAGQNAAVAMAKAIGGEGQVGIITGSFAVQIHEDRRNGFIDKMESDYPDIEIVGSVENGDDAGKALAAANDFMTANSGLKGIYVTAGGPFGAAQAVQQADKTGQIQVVSFDFVPETVDLVRSGDIAATIGQDPFGESYNTAIWLYNYLVTKTAPIPYFQPVSVATMTPDNVDEVLATQSSSS